MHWKRLKFKPWQRLKYIYSTAHQKLERWDWHDDRDLRAAISNVHSLYHLRGLPDPIGLF